MITIFKRAKPVILTEAIVIGLLFTIPFVRLVIIEPGIHLEHILWTLRGCLIGPVELLVNPYLSQQPDMHVGTPLLLGIIGFAMMSTHFVRPNRGTMAIAVLGTLLWILSGLCGAWAWT